MFYFKKTFFFLRKNMKYCGLGRKMWPGPGVAVKGRGGLKPGVLLPAVSWDCVTADPPGRQKALPGSFLCLHRQGVLPSTFPHWQLSCVKLL